MLISMPTGISTICGAFQDILELLVISARGGCWQSLGPSGIGRDPWHPLIAI
jgi:hypothetical protein